MCGARGHVCFGPEADIPWGEVFDLSQCGALLQKAKFLSKGSGVK